MVPRVRSRLNTATVSPPPDRGRHRHADAQPEVGVRGAEHEAEQDADDDGLEGELGDVAGGGRKGDVTLSRSEKGNVPFRPLPPCSSALAPYRVSSAASSQIPPQSGHSSTSTGTVAEYCRRIITTSGDAGSAAAARDRRAPS